MSWDFWQVEPTKTVEEIIRSNFPQIIAMHVEPIRGCTESDPNYVAYVVRQSANDGYTWLDIDIVDYRPERKRERGQGMPNFGVKQMCESELPGEDSCPTHLLDMLSDPRTYSQHDIKYDAWMRLQARTYRALCRLRTDAQRGDRLSQRVYKAVWDEIRRIETDWSNVEQLIKRWDVALPVVPH
jgi:hypothetical protein